MTESTRTHIDRGFPDAWIEAWNSHDLDAIMSFFAEDARYLPGHGPELHGLAAIRAEFAPQFAGRYGAMTFDVYDQVIDESRRRATIRWACRQRQPPASLQLQLQVQLRYLPGV